MNYIKIIINLNQFLPKYMKKYYHTTGNSSLENRTAIRGGEIFYKKNSSGAYTKTIRCTEYLYKAVQAAFVQSVTTNNHQASAIIEFQSQNKPSPNEEYKILTIYTLNNDALKDVFELKGGLADFPKNSIIEHNPLNYIQELKLKTKKSNAKTFINK
ncbi:MAG: hypothetical protein ACP5NV_03160 [Candidatus Woesearchaeota archaeon]